MAPKTPSSLPLYEINYRKNYISRGIELFILFLLFSLLAYRFLTLKFHGLQWLLALICESWFTFIWILTVSTKWNQVEPKTYPPRLLERTWNFPAVDIFVTTADPVLEPPLITINTVLSLLAVDYPANKLACYVSDDGASIITYYSLVEASKFAKIWIPFCKKYNISLRAPFRYFSGNSSPPQDGSKEFQQDWIRIKDEYKQLCKKIQDASTQEPETCDFAGDFAVFSNIQPKNHPTIIKVILENKEGVADGLPHLVYISREKRPKHPHQFKAGAMNVLTRVSGVMTNAPFMLNVDCDMYANNPQVILHAMCYFLGAKDEIDCGFVQFPQFFYDGLKEDPYGNQLKVLHEYFGRGIGGIQGPFYQGSGCFHRRKVIYGLSPHEKITAGGLKDEYIKKTYGKSEKLSTSIAKTLLEGSHIIEQFNSDSPSSFIDIAHQVGSCGFEYGTAWGQKLGWLYGSVTEDVLTGLFIQSRGWKSAYCLPDPAAFLGCAPTAGPATMIQQKRWATGLFEVLFNTKSPIIGTLFGKLQLRQCMAYLYVQLWALRSIFEVCYAILPAYCLITNSYFLPKANEVSIVIPTSIFIIYNLYGLSEYIRANEPIIAWMNNQRMWRVNAMSAWLFGILSATIKLLGFCETAFEITKKDQDDTNSDIGRFTFDDSPIFVPGIAILLLNLGALFIGVLDFKKGINIEWGLGEVICIMWIVFVFWAFLKGLFAKGKYGIPTSSILKAGALALLLVHLFKFKQ
ncbi:cellulose synthase-like protein H1 [Solanum lycopersicum]|uniref:Cellulose synthase-like protein H1 n=1 Tax=Solanum lycopersicum TaxID=4081 RepID=A0A3Q7HBA1_SOLLC|nr:cellulose synthase-like protein H1 [Solanum lycopersicum]